MLHLLAEKLTAVCPIVGVNSSRVIHFKPEATDQQRAAAQAIADTWDFAAEETKARGEDAAKAALVEIDKVSVRAIREWVAAQPDAPKRLKDAEAAAEVERAKLSSNADESP